MIAAMVTAELKSAPCAMRMELEAGGAQDQVSPVPSPSESWTASIYTKTSVLL